MMKLADLTPEGIEKAIADFYTKANGHVASVVQAVSTARYSIPRERRRLGPVEFPYYLAADLDLVFRYALGSVDASATHIEGLCSRLLDVLHQSPIGRLDENWETLLRTPVGVGIAAARSRIQLRDDDGVLRSEDVILLSGLSPQKIGAARMKKKSRNNHTAYAALEVRMLFRKEGIPV